MYSSFDVDIRPGSGLGDFELGTSLWTVLEKLRRIPHVPPRVDVKYDPDSSAITPIILHVRPHLDLLFSGRHQRLHTICLRKLRDPNPAVILRYGDSVLSSPEEVLRRIGVSRTFGPTYPGNDMRYPGLWFSFEEDGVGEGFSGAPVEDKTQEVKRVFISQNENDSKTHDALNEVFECPIMFGDVASAVVKVHDGVMLHFYPTAAKKTLHVRIGETTAQDLTLDLGPPLQVHYREDERMKIHAVSKSDKESETGYFYNYFQHGIDFLISGKTHIVQKIILHTNIPGSPLFQRYRRCSWEIEAEPEDDEDDTPPRKGFHDRFETISHFLSPREPPPSMLLDRTDDENDLTLPSPKTRLYGYDGVILEVTESSQVASVMLF